MVEPVRDFTPAKALAIDTPRILENLIVSPQVLPDLTPDKISKNDIRSTLKASTLDGVFATIFTCATSGVLLTNFLLQLGATSTEIGLLSAMPMVVNCLQPVGSGLADRTISRRWYNLWMFSASRLFWLILVMAIGWASWRGFEEHQLLQWTLYVVLAASMLGALSTANWFSWIAVLVPRRLRGRYFGFRNSATSLTSFLGVPLLGLGVSAWGGGTIQGYGVVLFLGVVAGMIGLGCQFFMADVNPQIHGKEEEAEQGGGEVSVSSSSSQFFFASSFHSFIPSPFKDFNFLILLLYIGFWAFAVNLSAPFFNLYLLRDLTLDVTWVTLYTSLSAGANLLLLMFWGKLADKVGNRVLLIFVGIVVALTPLLWLGIGNNSVSLWLWLPVLHSLMGGTSGAIELCNNNIQMEIAPKRGPSSYFAIAAAVAGITGALGTTFGGFLAEFPGFSLGGLFALSAIARLVAIIPLVFVCDRRS